MLKRLIAYNNFRKDRRLTKEKMVERTLVNIAKTEVKIAELRTKTLEDYASDSEIRIGKNSGLWNSYRITLGAHKADLEALNDPEMKGRFSYERLSRRYALKNLHQMTVDFEVEQAKRAYEQRLAQAEQWLDDNYSIDDQIERLQSGERFLGCPIGNFEAVEKGYKLIS